MYGKLIVAAVAVLFLYVQLGATLQCYSCDSHNACKKPSTILCNQKNANVTFNHLNKLFRNMPYQPLNSFDCVFHNYTQNNAVNMTVKGCIYRTQPDSCHQQFDAGYINLVKQNCTQCSGNLCNERNSAAINYSSFAMLFVSIMGVFFAKILV